jgi:ABC-type branched-subunit amino acid transport system ATPase component
MSNSENGYMLELRDVNFWAGDFQILKDINLKVKTGTAKNGNGFPGRRIV